ncbi:Zn-dependent hydrolase [Halorussus salinisoli]|uniref:Zn-dependent hydrolase n=1 Tax=Halorussus salinisoli TaxID=2558242 RepID=UPI0010C1E831|nr:Zn-dependent hydrolase [Halorussus salinisoli]
MANEFNIDRNRLIETVKEQAAIGGTDGGGLHRLALSDEDKQVRDWFHEQMEAADLDVRIDEMGNMFGRRPGTDSDAAPVLLGSHLDSQPNGGIYDGALGVVGALEFVRTLDDQGIETKHPIEIVNWTNEEGSRFQPAMMASGVWAGVHDRDAMYAETDAEGNTLRAELERIGYRGSAPVGPQEEYEAYLELHVEQGPYLEEWGQSVGIVTDIVGFTWGELTFRGEPDHTGATPMHHRSDALVAAADVIVRLRRLAEDLGERTVATTGVVDATPNSINVIPGEVTFTWDARDPDDAVVEAAFQRVLAEAERAAEREGVDWEWEERMRAPSVKFADRCTETMADAAASLDYDYTDIVAGAGHDATHLAEVCDTGMVFAVSEGGKSHSEAEYTNWDDCYRAANVLANAALRVATGAA